MTTEVSPHPAPHQLTSNELATERTEMATSRTMMAADRSLMAWVRTGLSMISFGFTIYKLLESLHEKGMDLTQAHSPRAVGLFLTGLGTVSIVMGTVEYWHRRKELMVMANVKLWRPSFVMALLMSVTGLFLFFGITARAL